MRPVVHVKLLSRPFEYQVLRAIFSHENQCKSLLKLPDHPTTWGWASRQEIASRMGHNIVSKSLSRKIRKAFLWLEEHGYLRHTDVNEPGKKLGATRFLLAFWMLKLIETARGVSSRTSEVKVSSRTPRLAPDGWKPPSWSPLAAGVMARGMA